MIELADLQICTLRIGPLWCGIAIDHIQEITGHHQLTPVPLAPAVVSGLLNLRGHVITAFDIRTCFALPVRELSERSCHVVIRRRKSLVSFIVDDVGDVIEVDQHALDAPPSTLDTRIRPYVGGILDADADVILLLNVDAITAIAMVSAPS